MAALVSTAWAALAFYVVWLLRMSIVQGVNRLSGFEGWGMKFSLTGGQQAMTAAIAMAAKNANWTAQTTQAEGQRALDRASANRALLEGAEILWVDDRPSNNRNETRMLRSFGALRRTHHLRLHDR